MVPEVTCKILENGRNQQLYQAMMIMKPTGSAWCLTLKLQEELKCLDNKQQLFN